jgi:hypothetical protein
LEYTYGLVSELPRHEMGLTPSGAPVHYPQLSYPIFRIRLFIFHKDAVHSKAKLNISKERFSSKACSGERPLARGFGFGR